MAIYEDEYGFEWDEEQVKAFYRAYVEDMDPIEEDKDAILTYEDYTAVNFKKVIWMRGGKMITMQCKFKETSEDDWTGGIYVADGAKKYLICGCCGSVFEQDEIETFFAFETFADWLNVSQEIVGDG